MSAEKRPEVEEVACDRLETRSPVHDTGAFLIVSGQAAGVFGEKRQA